MKFISGNPNLTIFSSKLSNKPIKFEGFNYSTDNKKEIDVIRETMKHELIQEIPAKNRTCSFVKRDGSVCGNPVAEDQEYCKGHQMAIAKTVKNDAKADS